MPTPLAALFACAIGWVTGPTPTSWPTCLAQLAPLSGTGEVRVGSGASPVFAHLWRGDETKILGRPKWVRHVVTPREELKQIAVRYGVSTYQIREWNELESSELETRQKLKIKTKRIPPARERLIHTVAPGETWGSIAAMYRAGTRDLHAYNWKQRTLKPGAKLVVWVDPGRPWTVYRRPPTAVPKFPEVASGALSVGRPNRGKLINGAQVPPSDLYELREPRILWGSSFAVQHLVEAIATFRANSGYEGKIVLKSMSRQNGRRFRPHRSHQSGRDIDIQLALLPGVPETDTTPHPDEVDWEATWALVATLAQTEAVDLIFLDISVQRRLYEAARGLGMSHEELTPLIQYPRSPDKPPALVRHGRGHVHHIHVRFSCAPGQTRCKTRSRYYSRKKKPAQNK